MGDHFLLTESENTMPLHLAIQRELAYRRRMQELQPNPPTPFQGSRRVSSPSLVGKKRKTTCSNAPVFSDQLSRSSYSLRPFPNQSNELFCQLCRVPCSGVTSWEQHIAGKRHATSVQAVKKPKQEARGGGRGEATVRWHEMEWEMVD